MKPRKTRKKPAEVRDIPPPAVEGIEWAAEAIEESERWAAQGWLPMGRIVALDGAKSVGKSTVLVTIAAAWSGGPPVPGWTGQAEGRVLIYASEDPWTSVTVPRFKAAGGNPGRFARLMIPTREGRPRPPRFPADWRTVEKMVSDSGAGLLILDPMDDLVSGDISLSASDGALAYLAPLREICEQTGLTAICSRNHRKSKEGGALDRASGSSKINHLARVCLALDHHATVEGERVLSVLACSAAAPAKPQAYKIVSGPGDVGTIEWLGNSDMDLESILDGPQGAAERGEWREADIMLCVVIGEEWISTEVVRREMAQAMIGDRMLRRVKERLKIRLRRLDFGGRGGCEWGPPADGWPPSLLSACKLTPEGGREGRKRPNRGEPFQKNMVSPENPPIAPVAPMAPSPAPSGPQEMPNADIQG